MATFAERWDAAYAALHSFRRRHPHAWPGRDHVAPDGRRLGVWCHNVRTFHDRGSLAPERVRRLDAIGFPWRAPGLWQTRFEDLRRFRSRHPGAWPANRHASADGFRLGRWCADQRSARRRGEMRRGRIQQLDGIGFAWEPYETNWERGFGELVRWRKSRPDAWPAARHVAPGGHKLGSWCHKQRKLRRRGELSRTRASRLDGIGFPWDLKADLWREALAALEAFRRRHPRTWPRRSHVAPGGLKLGYWLNSARARMRAGAMPRERARVLRNIGVLC